MESIVEVCSSFLMFLKYGVNCGRWSGFGFSYFVVLVMMKCFRQSCVIV